MSNLDRDKWNAKYAATAAPREPSAVLLTLEKHLPRTGRAIDIAGGGGRHGIWLAQCGLDVTVADISPVGLAIAQQTAVQAGLSIQTLEIDLEHSRFPAGPWNLIISVCYLWRPLFEVFPNVLSSNGILAVIQPTKRNLERNDKPPAPYLVDEGELPRLANGLEIVHYEEGWLADGRHDAVLVARKAAQSVV
jgi:cyclopropane fatty-acyl-phospholipid synthase-like methyltransferase